MIWYIPSFFGDLSLVPTGPKTCVLTAEALSAAERRALEALTPYAVKKGWIREGTTLSGLGKYDLAAPIAKVTKAIAKALKPGRQLVTAVRFRDGRMEELAESHYLDDRTKPKPEKPEPEKPKATVTTTAPARGCPPPDFPSVEVRATRVLKAFLSPQQTEDFDRFGRFVSVGALTGHRYMVTHRNARDSLASYQRQLYDLDENRALCAHDDLLPAAEEALAIHVCLSIPRWEEFMRREVHD